MPGVEDAHLQFQCGQYSFLVPPPRLLHNGLRVILVYSLWELKCLPSCVCVAEQLDTSSS